MTEVNIVIGNIVDQEVGALVNAANSSLLGGAGVDFQQSVLAHMDTP